MQQPCLMVEKCFRINFEFQGEVPVEGIARIGILFQVQTNGFFYVFDNLFQVIAHRENRSIFDICTEIGSCVFNNYFYSMLCKVFFGIVGNQVGKQLQLYSIRIFRGSRVCDPIQ